MKCYDFLFDNELLSDHGFIICGFDGGEVTWSGGDVTYNAVQPTSSDRFDFYGHKFEEPLSCRFSITKNPCNYVSEGDAVTREEFSDIMQWLQRIDGYQWMAFNQDGWEDIWFHAYFNVQPHYIAGTLHGFDIVMNTDSPYGYGKLITKKFSLNSQNDKFVFINDSDMPGLEFCKTTFTVNGSGTLKITSGCNENNVTTEIKNINNTSITLDGHDDYISSNLSSIEKFNFVFPVVGCTRKNKYTFFKLESGSVDVSEIKIEYRYIRRVTV